MKNIFKRLIVSNAVILLLIMVWGGYQASTNPAQMPTSVIDIGGLVFMLFSVAYFVNSYLLFKFIPFGKATYLPLVLSFIAIGFVGEIISPMQVNKDFFYLIIFYIVSPMFFVIQGLVLGMIYFTPIKHSFLSEKE